MEEEKCAPAKKPPVVVQFKDVTAAAYRIKKYVKETPLEVHVLKS